MAIIKTSLVYNVMFSFQPNHYEKCNTTSVIMTTTNIFTVQSLLLPLWNRKRVLFSLKKSFCRRKTYVRNNEAKAFMNKNLIFKANKKYNFFTIDLYGSNVWKKVLKSNVSKTDFLIGCHHSILENIKVSLEHIHY